MDPLPCFAERAWNEPIKAVGVQDRYELRRK